MRITLLVIFALAAFCCFAVAWTMEPQLPRGPVPFQVMGGLFAAVILACLVPWKRLRRQETVLDVVNRFFTGEDCAFALRFYEPRSGQKYINIQLGDGEFNVYDDPPEKFFESAWVYLVWPPWEVKGDVVLAIPAEDESGMIVLQRASRAVEFVDEDQRVTLAGNFREFIERLQAAGWREE